MSGEGFHRVIRIVAPSGDRMLGGMDGERRVFLDGEHRFFH